MGLPVQQIGLMIQQWEMLQYSHQNQHNNAPDPGEAVWGSNPPGYLMSVAPANQNFLYP